MPHYDTHLPLYLDAYILICLYSYILICLLIHTTDSRGVSAFFILIGRAGINSLILIFLNFSYIYLIIFHTEIPYSHPPHSSLIPFSPLNFHLPAPISLILKCTMLLYITTSLLPLRSLL